MDIRQIIREELEKIFEADYYDRYPDFFDPLYNPQVGAFSPVGMHRYGEMVKEEQIEEDALRTSSLPDSTALFIKSINGGYTLSLYSPKNKIAYATITFTEAVSPRQYQVAGVAAQQGFGPFIYELAMMISERNGMGLMPTRDGDVRGDAWGVWKRFNKRDDVNREVVPFESEEFSFKIFDDHDELSMEEKQEWLENIKEDEHSSIEDLILFNTAFSLSPDSQFKELISRTNKWEESGFDSDVAIEAADELWEEKYGL